VLEHPVRFSTRGTAVGATHHQPAVRAGGDGVWQAGPSVSKGQVAGLEPCDTVAFTSALTTSALWRSYPRSQTSRDLYLAEVRAPR
jgi:hypothetical protein